MIYATQCRGKQLLFPSAIAILSAVVPHLLFHNVGVLLSSFLHATASQLKLRCPKPDSEHHPPSRKENSKGTQNYTNKQKQSMETISSILQVRRRIAWSRSATPPTRASSKHQIQHRVHCISTPNRRTHTPRLSRPGARHSGWIKQLLDQECEDGRGEARNGGVYW